MQRFVLVVDFLAILRLYRVLVCSIRLPTLAPRPLAGRGAIADHLG